MDLYSIEERDKGMVDHAVSITHQGKQASKWIGLEDGLEEHPFLLEAMLSDRSRKGPCREAVGKYGEAVGTVRVGTGTRKQGVE